MLHEAFAPLIERFDAESTHALDVGSANGPGNFWAGRAANVRSVDPDPRGLPAGGVCARLPELPFADESFDVVTAFDVIEHCESESDAVREVFRVLRPGGLFLMSVPAYQWAWTDFDVANGHHRRYTRGRAVSALSGNGFRVLRSTHAFSAVFPAFAAQRLGARLKEGLRRGGRLDGPVDVVPVTPVSPVVERLLLRLCQVDERVLRRHDLSFGSSVLVAAERPSSARGGSADRSGAGSGAALSAPLKES
jgi:SAM-dependent methyltransferase